VGVRLRAASVRGPAHIEEGSPNQDAVLIRQDRGYWLAVISDGMGSRKQAHIGSQAVCQAARQTVSEQPFEISDRDLVQQIYRNWLARISALGIRPDDAVATCLLAWGLPNGRFRLAQLGDGLILGEPYPAEGLLTRDAADFSNETEGLGLSRSFAPWHCAQGRLARPGDALVLMTDGISDDLGSTAGLVQAVVSSLRNRGARSARALLTRELKDWPTRCHGDDKTIAVVYRV
jgi:serine/threonine protein phosphatase PrpC